jgi:3-hydroxyacyl-CoA dehydrogenase
MLSSKLLSPLRKFSTTAGNLSITNVTVIGSGLMGSGIAQVAATAGNKVQVVDTSESALTISKKNITNSLTRVAKKQFKDDAQKIEDYVNEVSARISFSTDTNKAVSATDLVVEAIVENLEIKQKLFSGIDKVAPAHTIFTSNTSSIPIGEIAAETTRKDRFGGLHFFNPVPMMKLLEVIRIKETSDETFDKLLKWGQSVGKVTVKCGDTPGFIVNRLLVPYLLEAVRLFERGDASTRDIDTAMKLGAGYPMGPFELCDYIGVDVVVFITEGWEKRFPNDPSFKTPVSLKKLVAEGKLGVKSGAGWYDYSKK